MEKPSKNILVAPLNWGLGHATRCIPVIQNLERYGFTPIIASDGAALELLKLEFPNCQFLELPSYHISYPRNGKNFRWKMLQNSPKLIHAIKCEQKIIEKWVTHYQLSGIISDNRLGVYSSKIPCVFITHQLNVLTGFTTFFSTKIHQFFSTKFNEIWVPDVNETPNLSGKLGHLKRDYSTIKYMGVLSRFRKIESEINYDLLVLLSGPEPQRTLLEQKLLIELKNFKGKILFVQGKVAQKQVVFQNGTIELCNFMQSGALEKAINQSKMVLCRSGYTSIMDLVQLEKKAFFIPTPGQFEQEYLAEKFQLERRVPFCSQADFCLEKLAEVDLYEGFKNRDFLVEWEELLGLFDGK